MAHFEVPQFCSDAWFVWLADLLEQTFADHAGALKGKRFVVSEQYLHAPPQLLSGGDPAVTLTIGPDRVRLDRHFDPNADMWIRADYEMMRKLGATPIPTEPESLRKLMADNEDRLRTARAERGGQPPGLELSAFLFDLHNRIAYAINR